MRWSKIKNIIILLLVIVNVSLLVMVGQRRWRNEQYERETRQRVIAIMEKNAISFLPAEVPGELNLQGCRVTLEPPGEKEAKLLLGELAGHSSVGARTTWEGTLGSVTVSASGELEAELKAGAYPAEADMAAQGRELLSALGFQAHLVGREEEGEVTTFQYVQLWNGVPLPQWTAHLTWRGEALEGLTLRRLTGSEEPMAGEETIDAATALARFLEALNREGYVCSQVTDLYAGYAAGGSGTITLRPAWFIETDTSPWRFAVDGVTGAVSVAE